MKKKEKIKFLIFSIDLCFPHINKKSKSNSKYKRIKQTDDTGI